MGRPSKIHTKVSSTDAETGKPIEIPITEAIIRLLKLGVYPSNAAGANGISPSTLQNWLDWGHDALARAQEQAEPDADIDWTDVPEGDGDARAYARFLEEATRAEIAGLTWHEVNVRKAAASGKEQGGRLSLEFLSRRQRKIYGKHVHLDHGGKVDVAFDEELDDDIAGLLDKMVAAKKAPSPRSPAR